MSLSAFQSLIAELGQSIGAADMAAGDDGYVGLKIDDRDLHVQYEPEDDVVVLLARLQEVEPDRRAEIYSMMLAGNVFWKATRGATFSADFDTGRIFLADRRDRAGMDLESLSSWIERFANVVALWWDRIESADEGGPLGTQVDEAPATTPGIPPDGMPPGGTFA